MKRKILESTLLFIVTFLMGTASFAVEIYEIVSRDKTLPLKQHNLEFTNTKNANLCYEQKEILSLLNGDWLNPLCPIKNWKDSLEAKSPRVP